VKLSGEITVPGDKSITHRAILLAAIAEGQSQIHGWLPSEDCRRTLNAVRAMGISVQEGEETLHIDGRGLSSLKEPGDFINCGNSGTTLRLLTGFLAGQSFFSTLTGDNSLRKRPMGRVVDPLHKMGANIFGRGNGTLAPLAIRGKALTGIEYTLPIASAQVKSALLLAGLYASGVTGIIDPFGSRDHTERLLKYFGAAFKQKDSRCSITGGKGFPGKTIKIPSDFSSAAFFIVGALIVKDSVIIIKNVGMNPTRTGLLTILQKMGATIERGAADTPIDYEPVANIKISASNLKGAGIIEGAIIPKMIDEFPILCIAAASAEGETIIRGAKELRVKESDRIATMTKALQAIGVDAKELPDGIHIVGSKQWTARGGVQCKTEGDHRVAMAMKVAALRTDGEIKLNDETCIDTSFPAFNNLMESLCH
jgi:3-phosphoshikimate 1-carboxyvinyltransferase